MKTITKTESIQDFKSYFEKLHSVNDVTLWQVNPTNNKREILKANFENIDLKADIISFNTSESRIGFPESHVYFYSQDLQIIFKGLKSRIEQSKISLVIPDEIKILDDSEVGAFERSLSTNMNDGLNIISGVTDTIKNENFELNSTREHINSEFDIHESTVDYIEEVGLSGDINGTDELSSSIAGSTVGTEAVRTTTGGYASTDNLNTSMAGRTSTENLSTSMVGKGKTEHQNTKVEAKTKTEHQTTKVSTKTQKEYEQSQRDKDIFENELSFISLDEEDKKFAGQRDAPRARPAKGKMITMKVKGSDHSEETHELFDLSRGGLGVICSDETRYNKGDIIEISAFDTNKLDAPMLSIVRSVREVDESRMSFKVGMEFYTPE